jgi:hypothetical protein
LQSEIRKNVVMDGSATIYSDALKSYERTPKYGPFYNYVHQVIDHATKYADGVVHTNGMENYWSLLKRTIKGTYVSVEPFHLFRYLDEQAFRFNERKLTDFARFLLTAKSVFGKRLTFAQLTAAVEVRAIRDYKRSGNSSLMWRSIEDNWLPLSSLPGPAMLRFDIDFKSDGISNVILIGAIDGPPESGLHVSQELELRAASGDSGTASLSFDTITFSASGIYTFRLSVKGAEGGIWADTVRVGLSG